MNCCPWRIAGEEGVQFFGRMSASISHELKNVLAIINENAGLLGDLTLMADRGTSVDPERLRKISLAVTGQVRRADAIIRNMNRFAHSTDEALISVDLNEVMDLVLALAGRLAANRCVSLELSPSVEPVAITTAFFPLENLIWLCLEYCMNKGGAGTTVRIRVKGGANRNGVEFTFSEGQSGDIAAFFPGDREKALLDILKADLALNRENGCLNLILPRNISG
jgi:light-regulated signal transduction histidine kinase (bacteriophytochrome)